MRWITVLFYVSISLNKSLSKCQSHKDKWRYCWGSSVNQRTVWPALLSDKINYYIVYNDRIYVKFVIHLQHHRLYLLITIWTKYYKHYYVCYRINIQYQYLICGCINIWNNKCSNTSQFIRRVWRYQRGNQNPYIEEEQTIQWPKEKGQNENDLQNIHIKLKIE